MNLLNIYDWHIQKYRFKGYNAFKSTWNLFKNTCRKNRTRVGGTVVRSRAHSSSLDFQNKTKTFSREGFGCEPGRGVVFLGRGVYKTRSWSQERGDRAASAARDQTCCGFCCWAASCTEEDTSQRDREVRTGFFTSVQMRNSDKNKTAWKAKCWISRRNLESLPCSSLAEVIYSFLSSLLWNLFRQHGF